MRKFVSTRLANSKPSSFHGHQFLQRKAFHGPSRKRRGGEGIKDQVPGLDDYTTDDRRNKSCRSKGTGAGAGDRLIKPQNPHHLQSDQLMATNYAGRDGIAGRPVDHASPCLVGLFPWGSTVATNASSSNTYHSCPVGSMPGLISRH